MIKGFIVYHDTISGLTLALMACVLYKAEEHQPQLSGMLACLQAVPRSETSALKKVRVLQHLLLTAAHPPHADWSGSTFSCRHLSGWSGGLVRSTDCSAAISS